MGRPKGSTKASKHQPPPINPVVFFDEFGQPLSPASVAEKLRKQKNADNQRRFRERQSQIPQKIVDQKKANKNLKEQISKLNKFMEEAAQRSATANMNNNQFCYQ